MFLNLHPKCANPTCAATFEWLKGGKLFRFHRNAETANAIDAGLNPPANSHDVEHFWLCERCTHIYTLTYRSQQGVEIRPLWPELSSAKDVLSLPAGEADLSLKIN